MTITQLHYVLAIAEHKNFTKAAEKCFVTQPTLSTQIQKLEEELDIIIFDRGKKPIELTDVGRKIVHQARNIVNESDRIQDIVDQQKGFIGGEFRLGIIPTVMPTLLPMFLKAFIKKYPKVKLKIEELTTEEIIFRINEGHLDAAIAATPLENDNIKERVLYYEPFVGYIPYLHTLELNDKMKANLHHFVEPSPAREVSVIYHKSELKMQIVDALHNVISGIIRGAIAFHNVEIISPLPK